MDTFAVIEIGEDLGHLFVSVHIETVLGFHDPSFGWLEQRCTLMQQLFHELLDPRHEFGHVFCLVQVALQHEVFKSPWHAQGANTIFVVTVGLVSQIDCNVFDPDFAAEY